MAALIVYITAVRLSLSPHPDLAAFCLGLLAQVVMWLLYLLSVLWLILMLEMAYVFLKGGRTPPFLAFLSDTKHPRNFLPFFLLSAIFYQLGGGNGISRLLSRPDMTPLLVGLDHSLFGCQPSVAMQNLANPLLTEVMSFFYSLHPVLPVGLALFYYKKGEMPAFRNLMLAVVLSSTVAYVFFMLVPSASPVYVLEYKTSLDGSVLTRTLEGAIGMVRSASQDCCLFPSLHVALSTIVLLSTGRFKDRRLFYILLPVVVGSWLSTVYLRRHYAVDAIGGFALALLCSHVSARLNRWWYGG